MQTLHPNFAQEQDIKYTFTKINNQQDSVRCKSEVHCKVSILDTTEECWGRTNIDLPSEHSPAELQSLQVLRDHHEGAHNF